MQPHFPHDCPDCRFIGSTRFPFAGGWSADWYVCGRTVPGLGPTLIHRWGAEPPQYGSIPVMLINDKMPGPMRALHEAMLAVAEANDLMPPASSRGGPGK